MSAEIIRFIPRPRHNGEQSGFPLIALRSARRPDDLVMDHVDIAACEHDRADQTGTKTTNG
jgi:hypothetical protein